MVVQKNKMWANWEGHMRIAWDQMRQGGGRGGAEYSRGLT